jgi:hypothetical protein
MVCVQDSIEEILELMLKHQPRSVQQSAFRDGDNAMAAFRDHCDSVCNRQILSLSTTAMRMRSAVASNSGTF